MVWDPTAPVTNAPLLSAPVRGNFAALDTTVMAALNTLANGQVLTKAAGPVIAGVPTGTNGHVLTLASGTPTWQALPVDPGFTNPMTGIGDLIRGGTAGVPTRLAPGANGTWLTLTAGVPTWSTLPVDPGFANPMTAVGDLIIGGAAGAPSRLAAGASLAVLQVGAGNTPVWTRALNIDSLVLKGAPDASIALQPPGGHQYIFYAGGTGSGGLNTVVLSDTTIGKNLFYFNAGGDFYLNMWDGTVASTRLVITGAADSAGSGYRLLRTPN